MKIIAMGGGENGRPGTSYEIKMLDERVVKLTDKQFPNLLFIAFTQKSAENAESYYSVIKKNFTKAKETPNLIIGDYFATLEKLKNSKFDIIFLDPPFESDFGEKAIEYISKNNMLDIDGLIIYEHLASRKINVPNTFGIKNERKYGTITVSFIGHNND